MYGRSAQACCAIWITLALALPRDDEFGGGFRTTAGFVLKPDAAVKVERSPRSPFDSLATRTRSGQAFVRLRPLRMTSLWVVRSGWFGWEDKEDQGEGGDDGDGHGGFDGPVFFGGEVDDAAGVVEAPGVVGGWVGDGWGDFYQMEDEGEAAGPEEDQGCEPWDPFGFGGARRWIGRRGIADGAELFANICVRQHGRLPFWMIATRAC